MINVEQWPENPSEDPRLLPHDGCISPGEALLLKERGWVAQDVRLMPSDSTPQRQAAILAFLEGVRLGLIEPRKDSIRFIEMEMRACGLHVGKTQGKLVKKVGSDTVRELFADVVKSYEEK